VSTLTDLLREGGTEALGQLDATGQLLKGAALQPIAGLGGASRTVADLLRGKGWDEAARSGAKTVEDISGWGGGPVTERGAQRLQDLGATMKGAGDWATKNVPGVAQASEGWDKYSQANPAMAALTAGLVEAPSRGAGRAAGAAETAARTAAKAKGGLRADIQAAMEVPRSAEGLSALKEAGEGDIAKSMVSEKKAKGPTVSQDQIDKALLNRAELRSEPHVLPKPAGEMSDQEWADFGQRHGVDMTRTPSQSLGISDLTTRKEIMVPGGLEGKFTLPDVFELKANNFDPNALPQDIHNKLMAKFLRTYERPGAADAADRYNALNFSLLSPNAPLTQNEFLAMRMRARGPEDINRIAAMTPQEARANEMGTGAASRGGMGVKGTADYGNQPQLARLARDNPEMFSPSEGEGYQDVARRIMNQVPGLGPKTASLGVPFLDLAKGDTSAVDLHMIRNNMAKLMGDPELGQAFTARLADLTGNKGATADQLLARRAADPAFDKALESAAIDVVSSHPGMKYRLASGEVNPNLHPAIQSGKLAFEPQNATEFGPYYNRIVDYVNRSRGENPDLALFPEQWRLWDRYRGRVEPHEMAHPDIRKLPKMSWEEMHAALGEHKEKGYTSTSKDPVTGEIHSQRLDEAYPTNWKKMAYFTAPAAASAAALANALRSPPEGAD
jgi:hypothetical protein